MLNDVMATVREVAKREVMPRFLKVAHERKADGSLFTSADLAAQDALLTKLPAISDAPIVSEEMKHDEQVEQWLAGEGGLWCVDPIDGTSNFVNGLPYFAISVLSRTRRHGFDIPRRRHGRKSVDVGDTHADALDRAHELAELDRRTSTRS